MDVEDWIANTENLPFIQFIPVSNSIALKSVNLRPPRHPDPADRLIIATALSAGAPIVTKDKNISDYAHVRTIW